jgi:hypothetical protein
MKSQMAPEFGHPLQDFEQPTAQPPSASLAAKFQRILESIDQQGAEAQLVDGAQAGSANAAAIATEFQQVGNRYRNAIEGNLKRLSEIDPLDPRAMITMAESAIELEMTRMPMSAAIHAASSAKDSLNQLLRSQG